MTTSLGAPRSPGATLAEQQDEPSVMGAGGGVSLMPTRAEAVAAWRSEVAARFIELDVLDPDGAKAYAAAMEVDLSIDPKLAVSDEMECWDAD